jgi:hypothetical protein
MTAWFPRNSKALVVLLAARELLAKGWVKGTLKQGDKYCMVGSLDPIGGDPYSTQRDAYMILQSVTPCREGSGSRIANFNDHKTTTHAEVLAVYDKAIEAARENIRPSSV